jgi:hypothetical protein
MSADRRRAGSLLLAAGGAALGASLAAFVLTDANPIFQTPFHDDDFHQLATTLARLPLPPPRPVSAITVAALATLGPAVLYATLLALVVAYPLLCVVFVDRFLRVELSAGGLAAAAFGAAFGTFLYEHAPETFRYTGHITNALSTVLGMAAAVVMCGGASTTRRTVAGAVLFALSAYAKEDLVLFVPGVAAVLALDAYRTNDQASRKRAGVLLAVTIAIAASALLYSRAFAAAAFTSNRGVYGVDFHPGQIVAAVGRYLGCTRYAAAILVLAVIVTLLVASRRAAPLLRLALVWGLVIALVLPYAPLASHVFEMYAYNWLPLILAILVVGWLAAYRSSNTSTARLAMAAAAVVAAASLIATSHPGRARLARTITTEQARVRAVIDALLRNRDAFAGFDQVAVEGLEDMRTPWLFSDGRYVERLVGRRIFWLFVARPESWVARVHRQFERPIYSGAIFVVPPDCGWLRDAPRLRFASDMRSEVVAPDASPTTAARGRIDLGSPDAAGLFCGGWSAPELRGGVALRWVEGHLGLLALALDRERGARLDLGLVPAPDRPARTLHVLVDGTEVATVPVPADAASVAVTVPPRAIRYPVSHVFLWFADWSPPGDGLRRPAAIASITVE